MLPANDRSVLEASPLGVADYHGRVNIIAVDGLLMVDVPTAVRTAATRAELEPGRHRIVLGIASQRFTIVGNSFVHRACHFSFDFEAGHVYSIGRVHGEAALGAGDLELSVRGPNGAMPSVLIGCSDESAADAVLFKTFAVDEPLVVAADRFDGEWTCQFPRGVAASSARPIYVTVFPKEREQGIFNATYQAGDGALGPVEPPTEWRLGVIHGPDGARRNMLSIRVPEGESAAGNESEFVRIAPTRHPMRPSWRAFEIELDGDQFRLFSADGAAFTTFVERSGLVSTTVGHRAVPTALFVDVGWDWLPREDMFDQWSRLFPRTNPVTCVRASFGPAASLTGLEQQS